ncbi:MAG: glutathione S-transferase family protein [Rhodobacteraceae bacterium]|nr:glutathione S-transferase family protein [Paracoccaceae bacterium]
MSIILHCFGESGNSYKAALTLELSGLEWIPEKVDFFNGAARTPEFKSLNILGEAPVMVDGTIILSQSGAIQQYVSDKSGKLSGSPQEKYEILRWILFDNHKLSSQAGNTRFMMNFLPEKHRNEQVIQFMQGRLKAAYHSLDMALHDKDWLVGEHMTIADIANCGYLFYSEPFGFNRKQWINIDRWLSNIEETPGWKHPYDLMPGNPSDRL